MRVVDTQRAVADTHATIVDTQMAVTNTQTMVADARKTVTNTQTIVKDTQTTVTNTQTMVADIHRKMVAGEKDASSRNHSVGSLLSIITEHLPIA